MGLVSRRVRAGNIRLSVLETGAGGRPILLVHGFGGAKEDFADHLEALADHGWHAVAPDHRGHGASDQPGGEHQYSMRILADDLIALADALDWDHFVMLGHSMGGMSVQFAAIAHPDRLDGLVLMDTSHSAPDDIDPELIEAGKAAVRDGGLELLQRLQKELGSPLDTPAHARLIESRPGYREFSDGKLLRCSPDMWLSLVDEIIGPCDRLPELANLSVPTLVMVGEQDAPFIAHAERMAATIPDARLVVIPNAGHSPQFESPEAWWTALIGFLDEIRTRTPRGSFA